MLIKNSESERLELLLAGYQGSKPIDSQADQANGVTELSNFLSRRCYYAGDQNGLQKKFYSRCFVYAIFTIFLAFIFSLPIATIVFSTLVWLELFRLDRKADARAKLFERDYSAFLLSYAASVRTGLDPLVAFSNCAKLFQNDSLLKKEIENFRENLDRGQREENALKNFASSIRHPDLKLLRSAVLLARQQGSSLGECLQRLARITRQRQSFRRKIKAAIAMQRMSAIGISCCAFVIAIIQGLANPEGVRMALANPVGQKLLGLGVGLMLLGLVWMLRLARERV